MHGMQFSLQFLRFFFRIEFFIIKREEGREHIMQNSFSFLAEQKKKCSVDFKLCNFYQLVMSFFDNEMEFRRVKETKTE